METIKSTKSMLINALKLTVLVTMCISFNVQSQNPGNISTDLQLWLKADAGTSSTTNNTDVSSWLDNSPNGFNAVTGLTNNPQYKTDVINFNPALEFNTARSQKRYLKIPTATISGTGLDITPSPASPTVAKRSSMSIFAAFLTDGGGAGTMFSRATSGNGRSYQLWLGDRDRVVHYTLARTPGSGQGDPDSGINYGIVHARNDAKISSVTIDINTTLAADPNTNKILRYVNGYLDPLTVHTDGDAGFGTGETTNMDVLIGARRNSNNTDSGNELIGNVAELIVYNRALGPIERQKVETYMAIKYGITLGYNDEFYRWENNPATTTTFGYSGTSNNYLLSDGSTAWLGTDNTGFGYNVFGIARDDDSALLQLKSKSVHVEEINGNTSVITMEHESGSIDNDKDYLLVGNNGAEVMIQSTSLPERTTASINRIWKARESANDVGTVKLEFDLSQFGVSHTDAQELELIVSNSSNLKNYKNYLGTYNSTTQIVTFTRVDLDDAEYFTLAKLEELESSYHLKFDGTSQYVDLDSALDLNPTAFTISAWINRDPSDSYVKSIISKRDAAFTTGFDFRILNTNKIQFYWKTPGVNNLLSTASVPKGEWHHVAVIYDGTTAYMYIDGVLDNSVTGPPPVATDESLFIGAAGKNSPIQHFGGNIDEVRVWNTNLSESQLRFIMNQEIEANGSMTQGKIIPNTITKNEIASLPWVNLKAYYPFSHVRGNCLFNKSSNITENGRLYNTPTTSIDLQTAPLPYISNANGNWDDKSTWLNGNTQSIPGATSIVDNTKTVEWNIVISDHDIRMNNTSLPTVSNENRTVCALFVESGKITLIGDNITNTGNGVTISHYLTLDGKIDLEGESQLIQTNKSDFDVTSSGAIEKDQQGTKDYFTYNYWSSPVGVRSTTSNNNSYTLNDNIFKDGTDPAAPVNINFVTGYDGSSGTPIGIAKYWIWKYNNRIGDDYASWQHVRNTGTIFPGESFTMKGVSDTNGDVALEQNYVFEGKPNNGDITLPINAGNDYLVGNPYPSAIDADQFILYNGATIDGSNPSITGSLYFWEHWGGGSHILQEYQGGYATYNLSGGIGSPTLGTNDPDVGTGGVAKKIPGRYIPVGQGFFVTGEITGNIKFANDQRVFGKEGISSSVFVRQSEESPSPTENADNGDDRFKIRLGFNSVNTIYRQLLVTVDERASMSFDFGFDAKMIEDQIDDMYWMIDNDKYTVQGINDVNEYTIIPIGIHTRDPGINTIAIDALINAPEDLQVYLHDKDLDLYHDLNATAYQVYLDLGEHLERFEITFTNQALSVEEFDSNNGIELYFANDTDDIVISNPKQLHIDSAQVINMLGQSVYNFDTLTTDNIIKLQTKNLNTGTYIIKLKTEIGDVTKKVLVN